MQDIRKYGINNFSFEILEECLSSQLSDKEKYYIKILNPFYNKTSGGRGGNVKLPEKFFELIQDLRDNILSYQELGEKYNYSKDSIGKINSGKM